MPYKLVGKTIFTKKSGKWKVKQVGKSVASAKRALKLLRGLESGSIKPSEVGKGKFAKKRISKARKKAEFKKQDWKRKVDKKMKDYGDIDYQKKRIRINPKKGEMLTTILHEEEHRKYPSKTEKLVEKAAKAKEKKLSPKKAIKLLKKYK